MINQSQHHIYVEEHLKMSTKESMEKVGALQEAVQSWRKKDMAGGGEAHGEVLSQLRALRDELGAEANHNEYASSTKRKRNGAGASVEGIPSKRGKGKVAQAEVGDATTSSVTVRSGDSRRRDLSLKLMTTARDLNPDLDLDVGEQVVT
jgi:hypothetical protein